MNIQLIDYTLFAGLLLNGFFAGIGFFTAIGLNPAIKKMSDETFAELWQHLDYYMAKRMSKFGSLLLLSFIANVIVLSKEWRTVYFWLIVLAFAAVIADIIFTLSVNHPLNKIIQSWDFNNLPQNVQQVKEKVVRAFNKRVLFMISSFIMLLAAVWLRIVQ